MTHRLTGPPDGPSYGAAGPAANGATEGPSKEASEDLLGAPLRREAGSPGAVQAVGFGAWIELEDRERMLLARAQHVVVAAVDRSRDGSVGALRRDLAGTPPESRAWREDLGAAADDVDRDRITTVAIALCTVPASLPPAALTSAPAIRRLDAVLDLWDVPLHCVGIQAAFLDTLRTLSSPTASGSQLIRAADAARPYTKALALFHPVLGKAADYGLRYLDEHAAAAAASPPAQDRTDALARALLACQIALRGAAQRHSVERIRNMLLSELRDPAAADVPVPPIVLSAAVSALTPLAAAQPIPARDAPDLAGCGLADARQVLANLGIGYDLDDELSSTGKTRMILSDANWHVAAQAPLPNGVLQLRVRKNSERRG